MINNLGGLGRSSFASIYSDSGFMNTTNLNPPFGHITSLSNNSLRTSF